MLLVVLHACLARLFPAASINRLFLASFAACFALTLAADAGTTGSLLDRIAPDVLAYTTLGYSYFHFFNMSETGRRVRLLLELSGSPQGLTAAELLGRYGPKAIVELRAKRLLRSGHLVERDGRLFAGKGWMGPAAALIALLGRLVLG